MRGPFATETVAISFILKITSERRLEARKLQSRQKRETALNDCQMVVRVEKLLT